MDTVELAPLFTHLRDDFTPAELWVSSPRPPDRASYDHAKCSCRGSYMIRHNQRWLHVQNRRSAPMCDYSTFGGRNLRAVQHLADGDAEVAAAEKKEVPGAILNCHDYLQLGTTEVTERCDDQLRLPSLQMQVIIVRRNTGRSQPGYTLLLHAHSTIYPACVNENIESESKEKTVGKTYVLQ